MVDVCCLLPIGLFFFILLMQRRYRAKVNTNFEIIAGQLGMGFNPGHGFNGTVMSGEAGRFRHRCKLYFERRRSGRKRRSATLVARVGFLKPRSIGLEITPQGFLAEGITIGSPSRQDIQIGHQEFDSGFRIRGFDEFRVKEFLDPERIRAILAFKKSTHWFNRMTIDDEGVTVRLPSTNGENPDYMKDMISQMLELASRIEKLR